MLLVMLVMLAPQKVYAEEKSMDIGNGLTISEGEVYSLKNASSGWHMNVKGAGKTNGTHINLWPLDMSEPNTQCFTFTFTSTENKTLKISPVCALNMYLDVRRGGKTLAPAQKMCIWEEDGDPVKEIIIETLEDGSCYLTLNSNKDYCIGAASVTAAETKQTQLVVCKKTGAVEQRWFLCDENGMVLNSKKGIVYESTIAMLDTLLVGLNETKENFSESNYWVYDSYHMEYLPELIKDVELIKEMFVELYETASTSENADCSFYRQTIHILCDEVEKDIQSLQWYQSTSQVKLIGGNTLQSSINEIISWFEWMTDVNTMMDKIVDEAYLTEVELQARMEELVKKLLKANKKIEGNENAEFAYFTTTGKELKKDRDLKCKNTEVISQTWFDEEFKDEFGSVDAKRFPSHLASISSGDDNIGYSCFGFGAFAQWYIYKNNNADWVTANQVEKGTYTKEFLTGTNVQTGEANLQVGDIIRIYITKNGKSYYHTMIFHSFTENGLKVLDCNLMSDNKVCIEEVSYNRSGWNKDTVWIYRVR